MRWAQLPGIGVVGPNFSTRTVRSSTPAWFSAISRAMFSHNNTMIWQHAHWRCFRDTEHLS